MMRRFETMMAMATTRIRLACMRASNECSSMPPPFRAASPHPPLDAFTLHPFCNLSTARYWIFLGLHLQLLHAYLSRRRRYRSLRTLEKKRSQFLGEWILDTKVVSSRILIYNRCITVNLKKKKMICMHMQLSCVQYL